MTGKDHETAIADALDSPARTDGGTATPFETVSQIEETRRDRFDKTFDRYIRAPVSIVWSDWRARIGLTIVVGYLLVATVGTTVIEPTRAAEGPAYVQPFQDMKYILGTDKMGRDLLSQVVHSTPTMLKMITAGATFSVTLGTLVGAVAGYKGGTVDTVLSSITDVFINIPGFPLVMVLTAILDFGANPYLIGVLLSVAAWSGLARAIRSQVLTLRHESFVESARSMGLPTHTIVSREIIPPLLPYIVINLTNAARRVIFEAAALYYLGILPYEDLNWGITLQNAYTNQAYTRPEAMHWFLTPMLAIVGISIGLILLGQSLDRVFNPRVRARHEKTAADDDSIETTSNL